MTKKTSLLVIFAIPIFVVLIAAVAFSGYSFGQELITSFETSNEIPNEIIPQAFAAKPNFVILSGTELVSQSFLDENSILIQTLECKIKMADTIANSQVMWCAFSGEIEIAAALFVAAQLPPEDIISVSNNILDAGPSADSFISLLILEFLNNEIEANTGMDLSNPNGFEGELSAVCENLDDPDPTCITKFKVKEMWG